MAPSDLDLALKWEYRKLLLFWFGWVCLSQVRPAFLLVLWYIVL